jgi:hypothetical protein
MHIRTWTLLKPAGGFFGVVAVWHSLQSTTSPGEIPGYPYQPISRGNGTYIFSTCKQDPHWLRVAVEPDLIILGLQARKHVNAIAFMNDTLNPCPFFS